MGLGSQLEGSLVVYRLIINKTNSPTVYLGGKSNRYQKIVILTNLLFNHAHHAGSLLSYLDEPVCLCRVL